MIEVHGKKKQLKMQDNLIKVIDNGWWLNRNNGKWKLIQSNVCKMEDNLIEVIQHYSCEIYCLWHLLQLINVLIINVLKKLEKNKAAKCFKMLYKSKYLDGKWTQIVHGSTIYNDKKVQ